MRYPEEWLLGYEEFKRTELADNIGIYDRLSKAQFKVLQRYFRWRTRSKFKQICNDTSLYAKPNKIDTFVEIMGEATDWEYAGCSDTGYMGGGICDLGHTLRYEHYAYSKSLDKYIKFGITCVCDFFSLDSDKLSKIQKVQAGTLDEIKFIVFIMRTGKAQQFVNWYYRDIPDMVSLIGEDNIGKTFGAEYFKIMEAFIDNKIVFTDTLLDRVNTVREEYYKPLKHEVDTNRALDRICESNNNLGLLRNTLNLYNSHGTYFTNRLLDFIVKYDGVESVEVGKYLDTAIDNAITLEVILYKIDVLLGKEKIAYKIRDLISEYKSDVKLIRDKRLGKSRLVYIEEQDYIVSDCYKQEIRLDENTEKKIIALNWAIYGKEDDTRLIGDYSTKLEDPAFSNFVRLSGCVYDANKWLYNGMRNIHDFVKPLIEFKEKITYKHRPHDIIYDKYAAMDEVVNYLRDNCPKDSSNWLYNLANRILESYDIYGRLSEKQKIKLRDAYNSLIDWSNKIKEDTNNKESNELCDKAKFIASLKGNTYISTNTYYAKAISVAETILRYGGNRVSSKQAYVINTAYDKLTAETGIEDKKDKKNSSLEYFNDMSLDGTSAGHYSRPALVEDISNADSDKEDQDDYSRDTAIGVDIPNLVNLSNALGTGLIKLDEGKDGDDSI